MKRGGKVMKDGGREEGGKQRHRKMEKSKEEGNYEIEKWGKRE